MKHIIITFFIVLLCVSFLCAQHKMKLTIADNNSNLYSSYSSMPAPLTQSVMYEGVLDFNRQEYRSIPALSDGEILAKIATMNNPAESIRMRLVNSSTTANVYDLILDKGKLFVIYPGLSTQKQVGTYALNDVIRVVRCQNAIYFYKNNMPLDFVAINNNNFPMYGEIKYDKIPNVAYNTSLEISFAPSISPF